MTRISLIDTTHAMKLIDAVEATGGKFVLKSHHLHAELPEDTSASLIEELQQHKDEIFAALCQRTEGSNSDDHDG
jgi:GMP synthase PP-ATPase subunit